MKRIDYQLLFWEKKCVVLIPTYNNQKTIQNVIERVLKFTDQVIVVNDGSTDTTSQIVRQFQAVKIIEYPLNRGKGFALKTGFKAALDSGYEYAITIDSDGQHYPEDLPVFLEKLEVAHGALMIGSRNMSQAGIPGGSSFGHKFSNFWFWAETGIRLPDTQSGYRLYPIKLLEKMRFFTNRYEFEIEVIVRAAWKGIKVIPVPINVYYAPGKERISHFRPYKDFFRISVLNSVLFTIACLWFYPFRFILRKNRNAEHADLTDFRG